MPAITNEGTNTLSATLKDMLTKCDRVDALVGYFYFSGFNDLYEDLRNKNIRILVGMDVDKQIIDKIAIIKELNLDSHTMDTQNASRSGAKAGYIAGFSKIFNDTDQFDNEKSQEAFKIFLDKIKDGSLQIKKTIKPNHSKFYILHNKEEFLEKAKKTGVVVEGSSNLTLPGLRGQGEHNRVLVEQHYYDEDSSRFEDLWNDAENITIADIDVAEEFIKEIKKKIWLYALPDPELMYYRVLSEYFDIDETEDIKTPNDITGKYFDLKYQKDAIRLGMDKIDKFGGVIVADVVGLGKSIIAAAIANNMGYKTIIIAPPHLKLQWEDYRSEFDFNGFVYSTGKIEEALERHGGEDQKLLIILDEAHKHRNEDTESYQLLHRLCAGNAVMALSATPFNNDPKDIYSLIKLFSTPGQSTIKTVENLSISFTELFIRYRKVRKDLRVDVKDGRTSQKIEDELKAIATELRRMIEPLVIRRSRLDLNEIEEYKEDLKRQKIAFSEVRDPEVLEYELGDITNLYIDTLEKISTSDEDVESFQGVRYKPATYLKDKEKFITKLTEKDDEFMTEDKVQKLQQGQSNIAQFMRRLLVRRFESSMEAFKISVQNMINSSETMLEWYDKQGIVPIYKTGALPDVDALEDMLDREQEQLFSKLEEKGFIRIPVEEMDDSFKKDLKKDIVLLKQIRDEWSDIERDPKFEYFKDKTTNSIKNEKNRKIIVFSEFSDTVEYLYEQFMSSGEKRVFKYTSSDSNKTNKKIIRDNFDAGLEANKQLDDYDILIATDAISEGFNLHRAGTVINYDIPYNPTKVIQRVGRINRINKKVFDELYIYNSFPTVTGEKEIAAKAIATLKMNLIHTLLGEDTRIFEGTEELNNYFAEMYRKEKAKNDEKSWDAVYRNKWKQIKDDNEIMEKVKAIPHRARIARKASKKGVVAFAKKNGTFVFAYGNTPDTVEIVAPEVALPLFDDIIDGEKSLETTVNFESIYQITKEHIFKNNTKQPVGGRGRKSDALTKLRVFSGKYSPAKDICSDIIKIIKELDGLPEGALKQIVNLKIDNDNYSRTFEQLKEVVPQKYIDDIFETAERAGDTGELIVLSEELI